MDRGGTEDGWEEAAARTINMKRQPEGPDVVVRQLVEGGGTWGMGGALGTGQGVSKVGETGVRVRQ